MCSLLKQSLCKELQNHHIQHHLDRYITTLRNAEYLKSIGFSQKKAQKEIAGLWARRLELQKYDDIIDGKRQKKPHAFFENFDIDLD